MDNERKEYIYTDSSDVEHKIQLSKESFTFVQKDKSIHDTKFLTKPTTFLKDAFKRFCKNKSSVAGAIILGILLLGSVIIPIADPYDITRQHPNETFLEPKLFPTGTGFWDGTKRLTDVPIDPSSLFTDENGVTYGYPDEEQYPSNAVMNLSPARTGYVNSATSLADGGFLNFINTSEIYTTEDDDGLNANTRNYTSKPLTIKNIDEALAYRFDITVLDDVVENYPVGNFGVFVTYTQTTAEVDEEGEAVEISGEYIVKDYEDNTSGTQNTETDSVGTSVTTTTYEFNDIFSSLKESEEIDHSLPITVNIDVRLRPNLNSTSSLFIQSVHLYNGNLIDSNISWDDANDAVLNNLWTCNGTANLYHGISWVCDFTYDTYAKPYGNRTATVGETDLIGYVRNGWLSSELVTIHEDGTYDAQSLKNHLAVWYAGSLTSSDPSAYLNEQIKEFYTDSSEDYLPIVSINSITRSSPSGVQTYSLNCTVSGYKLLGYTSEPIFLLGTDNYGYDMLKRVFTGLLTSLGLGILIFAICFTFGLIWGATAGYFGGNVDIVMERFTDLLSGVPWIVIMTLCILNLGSNFGTFILAMCLTGWISTSSLTRTQFYRFRDREYTLASRTLGASNFRLIFKHILPNAMGTIITSAVLMIPSVIFTEASISYLGLGFQDMQSLGVILSDNQTYLSTYTYLILFPSVVMALIMISFNLFGNGLRDAFNPSLKGSD